MKHHFIALAALIAAGAADSAAAATLWQADVTVNAVLTTAPGAIPARSPSTPGDFVSHTLEGSILSTGFVLDAATPAEVTGSVSLSLGGVPVAMDLPLAFSGVSLDDFFFAALGSGFSQLVAELTADPEGFVSLSPFGLGPLGVEYDVNGLSLSPSPLAPEMLTGTFYLGLVEDLTPLLASAGLQLPPELEVGLDLSIQGEAAVIPLPASALLLPAALALMAAAARRSA